MPMMPMTRKKTKMSRGTEEKATPATADLAVSSNPRHGSLGTTQLTQSRYFHSSKQKRKMTTNDPLEPSPAANRATEKESRLAQLDDLIDKTAVLISSGGLEPDEILKATEQMKKHRQEQIELMAPKRGTISRT